MSIGNVIESLIEKSIDEMIAIMIVGSGIYRVTIEPLTPLPEWNVAGIGMVLMFYFGRKMRGSAKATE